MMHAEIKEVIMDGDRVIEVIQYTYGDPVFWNFSDKHKCLAKSSEIVVSGKGHNVGLKLGSLSKPIQSKVMGLLTPHP